MRIGINANGVINHIEKFQLEYGIPFFQKLLNKKDVVINSEGYTIKDIFGCTDREEQLFWEENFKILMKETPVNHGVKDLTKQLHEDYDEIYVIEDNYFLNKNNHNSALAHTLLKECLYKNGIEYDKIISYSDGMDRVEFYNNNGIDVVITSKKEDIEVSSESIPVIVLNTMYNREFTNENISRVNTPHEIHNAIIGIKEENRKEMSKKQIKRPGQFPPTTGYASIDQPHRQYYTDEEENNFSIPERKIWKNLEEYSKNHLDEIMMEYPGGHNGTKITYREFFVKKDAAARAFKQNGINEGDTVVIGLANMPEAFIAIFAANKIGATAAVINPLSNAGEIKRYLIENKAKAFIMLDKSYNEVKKIISDPEIDVENIITVSGADSMPKTLKKIYKATKGKKDPKVPKEGKFTFANFEEFIESGKDYKGEIEAEYKKDNPAIILYTGGSTGPEKGVMISDYSCNAIYEDAKIVINGTGKGDTNLLVMPNFHCFGLIHLFYVLSCMGNKHVLVPKLERKGLNKLFKTHYPIKNIGGVPTLFRLMVKYIKDPKLLSELLYVLSAGDILTAEDIKEINGLFRSAGLPELIDVRNGYGITEGTAGNAYTYVGNGEEGCVGIPMMGITFKVVKPETEEEIKYGEEGELCISGPTVALGYLNNPEENVRTFRTHKDGKRWLHTGDMGYISEEGKIYFTIRIKRMLIVSGHNVYPNRIEDLIKDKFKDIVENCIVVGKKDNEKGEIPLAKIKLKEGIVPSEEILGKIIAVCKEKLPNKQYWPAQYDFMKEMPLNKKMAPDYSKINDPSLVIDTNTVNTTKRSNTLKDQYNGNLVYMAVSKLYSPIYNATHNINVIGKDNIPMNDSGIIGMNYLSENDRTPLMHSIDRSISFLTNSEEFEHPLKSYVLTKLSAIPVDRYGDAKYAIGRAISLIDRIPLKDYQKIQPIVKEIVGYIESISTEDYSKPEDIVNKTLEYLSSRTNNQDSEAFVTEAINRVNTMPTSGIENGYGRIRIIGKEAIRKLKDRYLIAVHPEWKLNTKFYQTGELLPFKYDVARWARGTGSPIIPTAITGEHKLCEDSLIRIGKPIFIAPDFNDDDIHEAMTYFKDQLHELVALNLVQQESDNNTSGLVKIIQNLQETSTQTNQQLLDSIVNELQSKDTERNAKILRKII